MQIIRNVFATGLKLPIIMKLLMVVFMKKVVVLCQYSKDAVCNKKKLCCMLLPKFISFDVLFEEYRSSLGM